MVMVSAEPGAAQPLHAGANRKAELKDGVRGRSAGSGGAHPLSRR